MQTYELRVENRSVYLTSDDGTLVRTSVGVDQVHVLFDNPEWLTFPVTATFAQGDDKRTVGMTVTSVIGSDEWAAEGTVAIPWEAIDEVGPVRVTFQGTDSSGNHIITTYGTPLYVEESGDVTLGDIPADAPTVDQWWQAYADAVEAANNAATIINNLQSQLESIVSAAETSISDAANNAKSRIGSVAESFMAPATTESLGVVQIGKGIAVDENGVISTIDVDGMTAAQKRKLDNLSFLASSAFGVDVSKVLVNQTGKVLPKAIPIASPVEVGGVMVDGTSVTIDEHGIIHSVAGNVATATEPGIVKPDGTTITVDGDGTIHGASTLRPDGTTITVDSDGTIHGTDATPVATTSTPGKVKPDGTTIMVDEDGTIRGAERYRYGRIGTWDDEGLIFGDESDGDYSFPGLSSVGNYDFSRAKNMKKASLPDCVAIGIDAFMFCPISSVSASVCRTIDVRAFSSCVNLKEAYFPMCETVGESAFANCSSLSYVSMMRCKVIWGSAFYNCTKLSSVYIPSCEHVGGWAFRGCRSVRTIDLPACEYVGSEAFSTCYALSSVSLPKCRTLLDGAFMDCSELTLAELPECETVEASAFFRCRKLSNAYLPKCEAVGSHAFDGCWEINELRLPACRTIGSSAFKSCISLWEVTLSACEYIGGRAFEDTDLLKLDMRGVSAVPVAEPDAFYRVLRLSSIYVPSSLYSDFVSASVWSSYASKLISV